MYQGQVHAILELSDPCVRTTSERHHGVIRLKKGRLARRGVPCHLRVPLGIRRALVVFRFQMADQKVVRTTQLSAAGLLRSLG